MTSTSVRRALGGAARRFDWPILIPGAAAAFVAALLTKLRLWQYVGIDVMHPGSFEDLRQVTSTADCARTLVGWNISFGSCDPWQRPYNYPELWARTLAILHLGEAQASYIGYALIAAFALCMIALTALVRQRRRGAGPVALMTLAAVSPPSLFAMERGNIDIVILVLIVAAILLVARGWSSLGSVLAATAVILKLFPIGALALLATARRRRPEALVIFGLFVAVGMLLLVPQLQYIVAGTPQTTQQSFGVAVIPLAVGQVAGLVPDPATARLIGFGLFAAVFAGLQVALRVPRLAQTAPVVAYGRIVSALIGDDAARALVTGGGGCVLVAYLAGTSWDYRLVFLIPVAAGILRLGHTGFRGVTVAVAAAFVLLVVNYPTGRVVEPWLTTIWLLAAPLLASLLLDLTLALLPRRGSLRGAAPLEVGARHDSPAPKEPSTTA